MQPQRLHDLLNFCTKNRLTLDLQAYLYVLKNFLDSSSMMCDLLSTGVFCS